MTPGGISPGKLGSLRESTACDGCETRGGPSEESHSVCPGRAGCGWDPRGAAGTGGL